MIYLDEFQSEDAEQKVRLTQVYRISAELLDMISEDYCTVESA